MSIFKRHRARIGYTLKVLLGLCVLAFILNQLDVSTVLRTASRGNQVLIACALLLVLPNLGLQFLKWRFLARFLRDDLTDGEVAGSLFAGFSIGMVTPARLGELAGRALLLRAVSRSKAVALTVVDKITSMIVTAAAGACGILLVLYWTGRIPAFWIPVAILVGLSVSAVTLHAFRRSSLFRRLHESVPPGRMRRRLDQVVSSIRTLRAGQMGFLLLLSGLFYIIFLGQYVLLLEAFGRMRVDHASGAVAAALLAKSILPPLTIGELGIREGSVMFFLGLVGGSGAVALNASLLIFMMNVLLPALVGLYYIPRLSLSSGDRSP